MKYVFIRFIMLVTFMVFFPIKVTYRVVRAFVRGLNLVLTISNDELDLVADGKISVSDFPNLWT